MKKPVTSLVVALLLLGGLTQPAAAAPDPTSVVFVGDSITELCVPSYESFRPHTLEDLSDDGQLIDAVGSRTDGGCTTADPEHEGQASDTTALVLARLPGGLAGLSDPPEVAFVLLGTNDVKAPGFDVSVSTSNLEGIIAALRSENATMHIVLGTIPPYPGKPSETAALNAAIAGLVESGSSPVTVVDLHAEIVPATHLATDDIHLNSVGAAFVGQLVSEALVATGQLAEAAPTAPVSLDAEGGENEIALAWAPPLDDGGHSIIDYEVELTGPESRSLTITAPTSEAIFTDLDAGTYAVSVSARNQKFTGPAVTMTGLVVFDPPPPPSPWAPFVDEEAFITQQYLDFLGRSPDAQGLVYWESLTNDDQSNVAGVIEGFMLSPEFAPRRSVARLYLAFFDRSPDNGGFDYWTESIASGTANLDTVSQSFVQSQEFATTYGSLSDAEFVDLVYTNVLGRNADQGGYDYWLVEMAAGMNRGQVMTRFSESPEYVDGTRANVDVAVTYRGMLGREPEASGYDFWVEQIASNPNSLLSLISAFFETAEYAERVQNQG